MNHADTVLVLNAGSSSLKFGLYRRGSIESGDAEAEPRTLVSGTTKQTAAELLQQATDGKLPDAPGVKVEAVGVRVVHGGTQFTQATQVTSEVVEAIRDLARLAPLHNPIDADVIEAAQKAMPNVPVVAVFDTAFHHTLPPVAYTYALPQELADQYGLRRYGFHGISYRYVSERLLKCLGREAVGTRLILCHLGNGASVCALRDGVSVDTSMGLTPLEGLVMGTRSGDLDPSLPLYLQREANMSPDDVDDLLEHKSGLRGLSGMSADVRELEAAAKQGDAQASLALDVFAYRVCKYIGAYGAALGGLDALAFTGGIGEHAPSVRAHICQTLGFLGLRWDEAANQDAIGDTEAHISAEGSPVQAWVIPTAEERQIARETFALLADTG